MGQEKKYERIARELADAISSGDYPIGTILPTEVELSEQYGVSRATVRLSLASLQRLGLISRKRNVGTRVMATSPPQEHSNYSQSLATINDLLQYAENTRRLIQSSERVVADEELAGLLRCPPGKRWRKISTIRTKLENDEEPLCWTEIYVDEIYGDIVTNFLYDHSGAISELIEARAGKQISEVIQRIQAISVPERLAERLKVSAGSPALEISRRYLDEIGQSLIISFSIHAANRFAYEMRLRRRN